MATQSLKQYLERRRKVRRPSTRSSSFSSAAAEKARKRNSLAFSASQESIEQHARVESLIDLWVQFMLAPQQEFFPSWEALNLEFVELEQNFEVALVNPGVINPLIQANQHARLAIAAWSNASLHARAHAIEALILRMRSLINGYGTVAAHRIVSSRKFIEVQTFRQPRLYELHEEARTYYAEATLFQMSRNFCNAKDFNVARRLFRKAIHTTEEIFLTALP